MAGQQMYQQATNQQIQQAGAMQKLQEAQRQRQQQDLVRQVMPQLIQQGAPTVEGMQFPVTRDDEGNQLPGVMPGANQINQVALNTLRGALDPDQFKKVMESIKLQFEVQQPPKEEFSTTPQTLMVNGRPTSVLFNKSGGMKVISAEPMPTEEKVDTGSEVLFRDKTTGRITSRINKTLTPGEAKLLDIREREFGRGGFDIVQTPEGFAYVPTAPGEAAQPVVGAGGERVMPAASVKPPTEGQAKAASFLGVMKSASNIFDQPMTDPQGKPILDKSGKPITAEIAYSAPNAFQAIVGSVPWLGQTFERLSSSENRQRVLQAQQAWVRAKLRKESGAVIGADEMADEIKTFFPQIGDSVETIRQKSTLRQQAEQGFAVEAGPAAQGMQFVTGAQLQNRNRPQRNEVIKLRVNPNTGRVEEAQ
jgi:hypothetical protein